MADGLRMAAAFAVALLGTWLAVPLAVRLASRTAFYDRPGGYKEHRQPTPYLGGAAVIAGFLAAAAIFADGLSGLRLAALGALALLAVGTLDDRVNLGISARLAVEVGVAVALFASDEGWQVASADWVNLAITILWVVGLINAFNLMDNLDGAASTVAAVSAAGTGALALVESDAILAAVCLSLAGACAGFLRATSPGRRRSSWGTAGACRSASSWPRRRWPFPTTPPGALPSPSPLSWSGCRYSTRRWSSFRGSTAASAPSAAAATT